LAQPNVQIDLVAAGLIALAFMIGAHFGGKWANMPRPALHAQAFAVFFLACQRSVFVLQD